MARQRPMFNAQQFLTDHFNGRAGVVPMMSSFGMPVPAQSAVDKWYYRESIPGEWFAVMLAVLELEQGGPVSIAKYVKGS